MGVRCGWRYLEVSLLAMQILIQLPTNRQSYGRLAYGDFWAECYGQADLMAAIQHGNPQRDPLKPYGDTPLGRYRAVLGTVTPPLRSYGPHRVIELQPIDGDALKAAHAGRDGLWIHGGAPAPDGIGLRPTHGCVRLSDRNQGELVSLLEAAGVAACECEITVMVKKGT